MAQTLKGYASTALALCWQKTTFVLGWATEVLRNFLPFGGAEKPTETFPEPDINDDPETFTLPDGRRLGFSRFGVESKHTVFYLHGFPDSRFGAGVFDEPGKKLGVRVIGVDRAGIGLSSPRPNRTALDAADDIRHLAKHLKLSSYGIVAVSGGGPYALACARALPAGQLKGVAIVSGMGPFEIGTKGMMLTNKLIFNAFVYAPWLIRWMTRRGVAKFQKTSDDKMMEGMQTINTYHRFRWPYPNPRDAEMFRNNKPLMKWFVRSSRQFFGQGCDALSDECKVLTGDLGFRIEDIRTDLPVQLWYGKQDVNVPMRMGEEIAVRLGGRASFRVEDETHATLWINHREQILEELSRCL